MSDRLKMRDVAGILHFLTPLQMAEEIIRLDAVLAGRQPDITMGRVPQVAVLQGGRQMTEAQRLTALLGRLRERCAETCEQFQGSPERTAELIRSIDLDAAVREYLAAGGAEKDGHKPEDKK